MPRPTPLPPHLSGTPVTPEDARGAGLSPKALRGSRFRHEWRGLYVPYDWEADLSERCEALRTLLPTAATFTHGTAARLWGLPLPIGYGDEIHVTTPAAVEPPARRGITGHQMDLPSDHVTTMGGLPLTTPGRTLLDLAPTLRLQELVAAGDHAMRHLGLNRQSVRALRRWAKGRRGVRRLEQAEGLLDPRAESPQESIIRVWCCLAGLPTCVPNAEIWDGGVLVARVDLFFVEFRVALEYEGAYHRTREQYASDIRRRGRLAALGIEVVQIEATMMRSPRAVVLHIAQTLRRRGWAGRAVTTGLVS